MERSFSLLRKILVEAEYPDVESVDEALRGIQLTGSVPVSGIFPAKLR